MHEQGSKGIYKKRWIHGVSFQRNVKNYKEKITQISEEEERD